MSRVSVGHAWVIVTIALLVMVMLLVLRLSDAGKKSTVSSTASLLGVMRRPSTSCTIPMTSAVTSSKVLAGIEALHHDLLELVVVDLLPPLDTCSACIGTFNVNKTA